MTAQVPEILEHEGRTHAMCAAPLCYYLDRLRKTRRPRFHWTSSACHRGYVGRWAIRDGRLCLVELDGWLEQGDRLVPASMETAFPWLKGPLRAHWLSDMVCCPEGRLLHYSHYARGSRYERDRIFRFEKGVLTRHYLRLNPPEPLLYRIEPGGSRTCIEDMVEETVLPDPFGPDEEPECHRFWGRPPEGDEEAGYMIAAAYLKVPSV